MRFKLIQLAAGAIAAGYFQFSLHEIHIDHRVVALPVPDYLSILSS